MTFAGQRKIEPVVYPSTDDMGEHELQRFITEALRPLLQQLFEAREVVAHVGADTFFYWVEGDPKRVIAPDVYVLPGISQAECVASWLLWESKTPPSFALEIVGESIEKDYVTSPKAYDAMGCGELVVFDPLWSPRARRRVRWQRFARDENGALSLVEKHNEPRIAVPSLDAWLLLANDRFDRVTLRVATGDEGETLVATAEEIAASLRSEAANERAATERERAAKELAQSERDRERTERVALEEEIERLRAKLRGA